MIYIEPIKVKWEPGKEAASWMSKVEIKRFETWIAEQYVDLVKLRVKQQKFASKWTPLSAWYLAYKRKMGWSLKTWEATGQLISNLKVKSKNVVGFDNRLRHKVSGLRLLDIARQNEYGSLKIPARPLFRLVYWYMRKHVSMYLNKYMEEN